MYRIGFQHGKYCVYVIEVKKSSNAWLARALTRHAHQDLLLGWVLLLQDLLEFLQCFLDSRAVNPDESLKPLPVLVEEEHRLNALLQTRGESGQPSLQGSDLASNSFSDARSLTSSKATL